MIDYLLSLTSPGPIYLLTIGAMELDKGLLTFSCPMPFFAEGTKASLRVDDRGGGLRMCILGLFISSF